MGLLSFHRLYVFSYVLIFAIWLLSIGCQPQRAVLLDPLQLTDSQLKVVTLVQEAGKQSDASAALRFLAEAETLWPELGITRRHIALKMQGTLFHRSEALWEAFALSTANGHTASAVESLLQMAVFLQHFQGVEAREKEAVAIYNVALALDNNALACYANLALAFYHFRLLQSSVTFSKMGALAGFREPSNLITGGSAAIMLGKLEDALDMHIAALESEKASPTIRLQVYTNLASVAASCSESACPRAHSMLQQGVTEFPDHFVMRLRHYQAQLMNGNYYGAEQDGEWIRRKYKQVLKENPGSLDPTSFYELLLGRMSMRILQRIAARAEVWPASRVTPAPQGLLDSSSAKDVCEGFREDNSGPWARRITVAYFSYDFRTHPIGFMTRGLFAMHDRARAVPLAYYYGPLGRGDKIPQQWTWPAGNATTLAALMAACMAAPTATWPCEVGGREIAAWQLPKITEGVSTPQGQLFPSDTVRAVCRAIEHRGRWPRVQPLEASASAPKEQRELLPTLRLVQAADAFYAVAATPVSHLYEHLRVRGVDVFVDLMGYTRWAKHELMSTKLAPIVVNYLGYPGSVASHVVDYVIVDKFIAPAEGEWETDGWEGPEAEQAEAASKAAFPGLRNDDFSESRVYLPHSYQANDMASWRTTAESFEEFQLQHQCHGVLSAVAHSSGAPVVANFNAFQKLNIAALQGFARILRQHPTAVLWLLKPELPSAERYIKSILVGAGIAEGRIHLLSALTREQHLNRLACVDLFIDLTPYGAHSTASEALFQAVPVLALVHPSFQGRVGSSVLQAMNVSSLIVHSQKELEEVAVRLLHSPSVLLALRKRLFNYRSSAPLFDSSRLATELEAAYMAMQDIRNMQVYHRRHSSEAGTFPSLNPHSKEPSVDAALYKVSRTESYGWAPYHVVVQPRIR